MSFITEHSGRAAPRLSTPSDFWPLPSQFVGLEFEIENVEGRFNTKNLWLDHHDGSLRNGIEYVSNGPLCGNQLYESIREFFTQEGFKYKPTARTALHIHLDMGQEEDTLDVVVGTMCAYYILEDVVYNKAGEERRTLGFCYPLEDSTKYVENILGAYKDSLPNHVFAYMRDVNRYFGFNMASVGRHGTFEFRHWFMPPKTKEGHAMVLDTLKEVMNLKKIALDLKTPITVCEEAQNNPEGFISRVFGDSPEFKVFANSVTEKAQYLLSILCMEQEFINEHKEKKFSKTTLKHNPLFKSRIQKKQAGEEEEEDTLEEQAFHPEYPNLPVNLVRRLRETNLLEGAITVYNDAARGGNPGVIEQVERIATQRERQAAARVANPFIFGA